MTVYITLRFPAGTLWRDAYYKLLHACRGVDGSRPIMITLDPKSLIGHIVADIEDAAAIRDRWDGECKVGRLKEPDKAAAGLRRRGEVIIVDYETKPHAEKCPACGAPVTLLANFCPECAAKVRKVCYCWVKGRPYNCGQEKCPGSRLWWLEAKGDFDPNSREKGAQHEDHHRRRTQ